jgi:hypothetical protein
MLGLCSHSHVLSAKNHQRQRNTPVDAYTLYLKYLCLATVMFTITTTQDAQEIPITGEVFFTGSGSGMQSGGISTLTFNNPMTFTFGTGDYSVISPGTPATFAPISWTGSGPSAMLTAPVTPEWTIIFGGSTYQFDLLAVSSATMTSTEVSLTGTGVAFISGTINRDPTPRLFSLEGTGTGFTYTIAVPEPQTIALLVSGVAVALLWARRRHGI